jgi:hypothetical protein
MLTDLGDDEVFPKIAYITTEMDWFPVLYYGIADTDIVEVYFLAFFELVP